MLRGVVVVVLVVVVVVAIGLVLYAGSVSA